MVQNLFAKATVLIFIKNNDKTAHSEAVLIRQKRFNLAVEPSYYLTIEKILFIQKNLLDVH